ncbi:MAG: hypothetical protein KIT89_01035 [Microcella sp.]|uniref:hypothetical protein n=1 Tax=Microcella sp. TaxID=1913979 RepID=UPI0024CAF512|nr:hypothetical protein [Microcella sp.]UYN83856.1 MAG: hypothetical protein KIT89_01035 [Microcella sp.]
MALPGAPRDRWIEIDLDWFGNAPWGEAIDLFAERCSPLLSGASGDRGVILNAGWLADIVTEWTGSGDQPLPFRSRRYAHWHDRTYRDFAVFVRELRAAFVRRGIDGVRVGIFIAGLGHVLWPRDTATLYDLRSAWSERHPELYPLDVSLLPGPDLDPRVPLAADDYPYASHPSGVAAGMSFAELLAAQWASLAEFCDLDVIHLRDGFWGPLLYSRKGPYGTRAHADPAENESWTTAVIDLVRQIKQARPSAIVMAYSSAVSHTAEHRVGCVDLHAVVADGHLDVWIDQTWGGAWQDWWDQQWKGWSFQLANLLGHAAQLHDANTARAGRPCRHYTLIETWDGWEPWDTIHRTPGKLEWAIWAFHHAAVARGNSLHVPDGTYISWMTNPVGELLPDADVTFLASTLKDVEESVEHLESVLGPRMIVDHAAVQQVHREAPQSNVSEWIEDHVGMLLKWGAPVLSASMAGDGADEAEVVIHQIPTKRCQGAATEIAVGRFDAMPGVLHDLAVTVDPELRPDGYQLDSSTPAESIHLPEHHALTDTTHLDVRYSAGGAPLLVGVNGVWMWQPPDLHDPANALFPRNQYGSVEPYRAVATLIAERSSHLRVSVPPTHAPVTVGAWRSGGAVHILVGNLDTGWIGDSRWPRSVEIELGQGVLDSRTPPRIEAHSSAESLLPDLRVEGERTTLTIHVPSSGMTHVTLTPQETS